MMTLDAHAASDIGKVREQNEDSWLVDDRAMLYAVADGMGGHSSGEVASRLSIQALQQSYDQPTLMNSIREDFRQRQNDSGRIPERSFHQYQLRRSIEAANNLIFDTAAKDATCHDMGTTIVAIRFAGSRMYTASVGDSRIYRWRKGKLVQLTEDHSLANEYVKMKLLRREDLPRFPYRNVIVRALGLSDHVDVDTAYVNCQVEDRYLLASDGLTDMVADRRIGEILALPHEARLIAERLVENALDAGGIDNVTALVVRVKSLDGD